MKSGTSKGGRSIKEQEKQLRPRSTEATDVNRFPKLNRKAHQSGSASEVMFYLNNIFFVK